MDVTRVDRWLWAVRLFRTRSAASQACRGGHVRVNGSRVKPAASVRAGDRVEVRGRGGRDRVVEVARVIDARVAPALAAECLVDRSPPPPPRQPAELPRRERGSGRPSKRERRELERLRGLRAPRRQG